MKNTFTTINSKFIEQSTGKENIFPRDQFDDEEINIKNPINFRNPFAEVDQNSQQQYVDFQTKNDFRTSKEQDSKLYKSHFKLSNDLSLNYFLIKNGLI